MTPQIARGSLLPERVVHRLGAEEIAAYLAVSGDDNPIHVDPDLAQRTGLAGVPVPGMLVMGIIGDMIENWTSTEKVRRLSVSFVAPTLLDGDLTVRGKVVALDEQKRTAVIRVTALQSGALTAMGEAEIGYVDGLGRRIV